MGECSEELTPDAITATIQAVEVQKEPLPTVSYLSASMSVAVADETVTASVSPIPNDQLREAQKSDPTIHPVLEIKLSGSRPPCKELKTFSSKTKCLFREWDKLTIDSNGILYRTTPAHKQLVLLEQYKGNVLNELHN